MTKQQVTHKDLQELDNQLPTSLRHWQDNTEDDESIGSDVALYMGWGRLIFAHTYNNLPSLAETLCSEKPQERDIAFYLRDPHVVLSLAPQQLFLDPSHTYRLWLDDDHPGEAATDGFTIRQLQTVADEEALNRIYAENGMVQLPEGFALSSRKSNTLIHLVAVHDRTGEVLGTVTGVDHVYAFQDPEGGSSMWCLSVSPEAAFPGIGYALVCEIAGLFRERGRAFMDLSVMHDNQGAIGLYTGMGFQRVPVFTIKHKNPINEPLFTAPNLKSKLNPYAEIITNEARRRGVRVDVVDTEQNLFKLTLGGRIIWCRESLSDLTSSVAMTICDNKRLTRTILSRAGLKVPAQQVMQDIDACISFMKASGSVVVKPARGEQGRGISVDVRTVDALREAVSAAKEECPEVLVEQYVKGTDLRIVVIDDDVVAAAIRIPPKVTGTGRHTIRKLVEKQSRRRKAATQGESEIPLDEETERCITDAGYTLDDILPTGETLLVRKTANLHTGGVLEDVTDELHPSLREAASKAARALRIPVVGLDFLVTDHTKPDYVIIEANERVGLANHEPQPTAERFLDLLFPQTAALQDQQTDLED